MTDEYTVHDWILDQGLEDAVLIEDLDEAVIGVAACKGRETVVAYDYDEVVKIVRKQCNNCSVEEAMEYIDFNITDAYMGKMTPVFIHQTDGEFGV